MRISDWSSDVCSSDLWTAKRLFSAGFEVDRQTFDVPWFEASHCELTLGDHTIPLVAQPLAVETGEAGLAAPLRLAEIPERLVGAIAVVRLPFRRWSSLVDSAVREALADAFARGANGVLDRESTLLNSST